MNTISIRESDGSIVTLETHRALPSTVTLAREYAKEGKPDRFVVFSDGRLLSDGSIENGIFMSMLLRPSFFPSQASLLGCMTGAAVISALEEHTSSQLGLGWVNDVYCDGKKIGSASIEGKLDDFKAYEYLIITVSLKFDEKLFPPRLTDLIVEVFESGKSSIPLIIARNIISKFLRFYTNIKNSAKFMDIYTTKFVLRGRKIRYEYNGKKRRCRVQSVDANTGALIVNLRGVSTEYRITARSLVTTPKKIPLKKTIKA